MKEPGRFDLTPKRKPGFRIQPSVGKQGMTIEQPFAAPAEDAASPAEEAPATEVADLITPSAGPEPAAHPAEAAASARDYTRYQSIPPETDQNEFPSLPPTDQVEAGSPVEVPAEPLVEQHEPETLGYQPQTSASQEDGSHEYFPAHEPAEGTFHDAAGTGYPASGTTDEYGAASAEHQDPAYTGYYLEPGTPEYDAYYAAAPATGIDESTLTEDTQSLPYAHGAADTAGYTTDSTTFEYQTDPPAAEDAASLTSWDQAPASDPGKPILPSALILPGAIAQSSAPTPKPSPVQRSPMATPAAFQPRFAPFEDPRARSGFPFWSLALASLVFLALGAGGGYFFSRPIGDVPVPKAGAVATSRPAATPPLVESTGLKNSDQEAVDAAFAANKAGNFEEAVKMFADLQAKHPNWVSMGIEMGRSQLYQHDLAAAGTTLKDALNKDRAPSDAQFLLGLLFMTNSAFSDAEGSFAKAVALDPARPDFYYFWGELLRREGKPLEAASKFRSALLRNQYETAEGLYRLKMWLSDIQADQEKTNGTSAQIDAGLALSRPPMEALLAGAVRSIKAGQIKEAAGLMSRARQWVEPTVFFVIMQDPSFAQESWRPELADFFKPDPAPATADAALPAEAAPAPAAKPPKGK